MKVSVICQYKGSELKKNKEMKLNLGISTLSFHVMLVLLPFWANLFKLHLAYFKKLKLK